MYHKTIPIPNWVNTFFQCLKMESAINREIGESNFLFPALLGATDYRLAESKQSKHHPG